MKRMLALALLMMLFGASARADQPKGAAEGKAVFVKYKCGSCHTVASQGITKGTSTATAAAGARKPPDLSAVGTERKAEWIKLFLTKKEKIDGRVHMKSFRGTDAELTLLANWLASLKDESAAKKSAGKSGEAAAKAKEAAQSAGEAAEKSGEAAEKSKEAAKQADEAADKAQDAADEAAKEGTK